MRISRAIIENWRSVKYADFEPTDMTILVGANNSGKTNILSAINFLIGDRYPIPANLLDTDYYLSDRERDIHIQLDFDDAPTPASISIRVAPPTPCRLTTGAA